MNIPIFIMLFCIYVPIISLIVFSIVRNIILNKNIPKYEYVVKVPKFYLVGSLVGLISGVTIITIFTLLTFSTVLEHLSLRIFLCLVFMSFILFIFLYAFLKAQNCKLYVNDKTICVQPMFSKRCYYTFDDIKCVERKINNWNNTERIVIYFNFGKKLRIEKIQINYKELLKSLTYNVSYDKLTGFESYYGNLTP